MADLYSRYLANYTDSLTGILASGTVQEQETAIYELLKDISNKCEIIIQKTYIGGVERITKIDIQPKTINLFQDFQEQTDQHFMVVGKLFLGFLYCERFGESRPLYDALQKYKQVTNYPITETQDTEWMLLESGMLLEPVITQVLNKYAVNKPEKTYYEKALEVVKQTFLKI